MPMAQTEMRPTSTPTLREQARKAAARKGTVMFVVAAGSEENGAVIQADAFGTRSELAIFYVVYPPGWRYRPGAFRAPGKEIEPSHLS